MIKTGKDYTRHREGDEIIIKVIVDIKSKDVIWTECVGKKEAEEEAKRGFGRGGTGGGQNQR